MKDDLDTRFTQAVDEVIAKGRYSGYVGESIDKLILTLDPEWVVRTIFEDIGVDYDELGLDKNFK